MASPDSVQVRNGDAFGTQNRLFVGEVTRPRLRENA